MRRRWLLTLAIAAALAAGCGDRNLVLKVDVLSYLDPAAAQTSFGPLPPFPGGFYTGEQEIVKDKEVNLVDGTNSIAEVEHVSISMTVIAADSTGSGSDTLRLYICEVELDPLSTAPVMVLPIALTSGVTDTVSLDIGTDSRVADLFSGKRMRMTLTNALRGPDSGVEPLNARVMVTALDAVLVAGRKRDL